MDPGESAVETCAREVLEERGLVVEVDRLVGVYTTPHGEVVVDDDFGYPAQFLECGHVAGEGKTSGIVGVIVQLAGC